MHLIVPHSLCVTGLNTLSTSTLSPVGEPASRTEEPEKTFAFTDLPWKRARPTSRFWSMGSPMRNLEEVVDDLGMKRINPEIY
jgi:hypothetical protein